MVVRNDDRFELLRIVKLLVSQQHDRQLTRTLNVTVIYAVARAVCQSPVIE